MNGLDKITARIEADASADAAAIVREAKERCTQILAEADRASQDRYWECAREGMKSVEARTQRLSRAADMEARKTILAFKQETVSSVFDRVREQLLSLPRAEYLDFLTEKVHQAATVGDEELILNEKDRKELGPELLGRAGKRLAERGLTPALRLSEETGDFPGGVIVRRGDVSVNCSIDALVEQARSDLAAEVAATLFS